MKIITTTDTDKIRRICGTEVSRLHHFGSMCYWYREPENIKCISYLKDEDPVGCAIFGDFESCTDFNVGVYIRPGYRRLGYGTKLVKEIYKKLGEVELHCDAGTRGRKKFFQQFNYVNKY